MGDNSPDVSTSRTVDALVQLSFAVQLTLTRAAAMNDLSVTQLRLLGILRELDRSSVSGLIDRAERRGLVARRTSKTDARVTLVEATAEGLRVGARIALSVSEALDEVLRSTTAEDRACIERLSASLARS
jgi:DNA-binding MarR family transcriptional regulator